VVSPRKEPGDLQTAGVAGWKMPLMAKWRMNPVVQLAFVVVALVAVFGVALPEWSVLRGAAFAGVFLLLNAAALCWAVYRAQEANRRHEDALHQERVVARAMSRLSAKAGIAGPMST
jgi:hypothetical protein